MSDACLNTAVMTRLISRSDLKPQQQLHRFVFQIAAAGIDKKFNKLGPGQEFGFNGKS